MRDAIQLPRICSEMHFHPWDKSKGWIVHDWHTNSHEESVELADKLQREGWSLWILGNTGRPGLVVYRVDQEYWREKHGHDRPWMCSKPPVGVVVEVCRDNGSVFRATAIDGFYSWQLECGRLALMSEFKLWRHVTDCEK